MTRKRRGVIAEALASEGADQAPAAAAGPSPSLLDLASVQKYRDELRAREADLKGKLGQLQAAAQQIVGQLNQVAGEITAVNRILGEGG